MAAPKCEIDHSQCEVCGSPGSTTMYLDGPLYCIKCRSVYLDCFDPDGSPLGKGAWLEYVESRRAELAVTQPRPTRAWEAC